MSRFRFLISAKPPFKPFPTDVWEVCDTLTGKTNLFYRATVAKAFVALMIGSDKPFADYAAEGEMAELLEAIKGTRAEKYGKWFRLDETSVAPFDLEWVKGQSLFYGQTSVEMDYLLHVPKE